MNKVAKTTELSKFIIAKLRIVYNHFSENSGLWLMFSGLSFMFIPTLWSLLVENGLWTDDEHAHGPVILGVSIWLLWKRWQSVPELSKFKALPSLAWTSFLIAASMYIPGRALDIIYIETASFIFAMAGIVLMAGGLGLLNKLKFPLFFMIFMVPLPNSLVGPITDVMKLAVSAVTIKILALAGFQVARSGVVIYIEQYQLLVADACAGMRTLFMLEALGILYLNLVHYQSMIRNIVLPILIVPISFTANVIRVIFLALITYYFGLDFGMGFMHGFAGAVLFVVGLFMMFSADSLLRFISRKYFASF
jgi:exosortase B